MAFWMVETTTSKCVANEINKNTILIDIRPNQDACTYYNSSFKFLFIHLFIYLFDFY